MLDCSWFQVAEGNIKLIGNIVLGFTCLVIVHYCLYQKALSGQNPTLLFLEALDFKCNILSKVVILLATPPSLVLGKKYKSKFRNFKATVLEFKASSVCTCLKRSQVSKDEGLFPCLHFCLQCLSSQIVFLASVYVLSEEWVTEKINMTFKRQPKLQWFLFIKFILK